MNVPTLTMDVDLAQETYDRYKAALESRETTEEDAKILLGYKALAAGKQLLDLHQVFRSCPLDQLGRPMFAVGRAHWKWCHFRERSGAAHFVRNASDVWHRGNTGKVVIPAAMMPERWDKRGAGRAMVPVIPPTVRPRSNLQRYHILWEAEWQAIPPTDPLLLSRLSGVILAAWDLTDLERAVLAGRFLEPQS